MPHTCSKDFEFRISNFGIRASTTRLEARGLGLAGQCARRSVPVFALSGDAISNGIQVESVNAKTGSSREARQQNSASNQPSNIDTACLAGY